MYLVCYIVHTLMLYMQHNTVYEHKYVLRNVNKLFIHMCVYVCMYVCMYVCVCVCVRYVCV